jgi:squalene synthase HpnC
MGNCDDARLADQSFENAQARKLPRRLRAHRATILAYYRFARGADDVADSPSLAPDAKLAGLDLFEATLTGRSESVEAALPLRAALAGRKLSPRHALDLLRAFRMDAVKHRYANWSELMDYCAYSAAPVGRFVLDVHGESESTWPASDALCTALQIINHLQDCGADYRNLDRVYIPQDAFAAQGLRPDALGAAKASPELRAVLQGVARRTAPLVELGCRLPAHLTKSGALAWSSIGVADGLRAFSRPRRIAATPIGGA